MKRIQYDGVTFCDGDLVFVDFVDYPRDGTDGAFCLCKIVDTDGTLTAVQTVPSWWNIVIDMNGVVCSTHISNVFKKT